MKNKSLSSLGFIVDNLKLSTSALSAALHVDSSLVSKWKSGNRILSPKSAYYEDFVQFILSQQKDETDNRLKNTLLELYPHDKIETVSDLEYTLHKALSNTTPVNNFTQNSLAGDHSTQISALLYTNTSGQREAVLKLLDYAEAMTSPGEFTFIDNEQYGWLLEDDEFATQFTKRMVALIKKGFHATFVLYFSSDNSKLIQLFNKCSPLIFHRNISWHYKEYYDASLIDYSMFILNKAISVLGLSVEGMTSSTMIFTDSTVVIKHESMAQQIVKKCSPLFRYFDIFQIKHVITSVSKYRKNGTNYSFLPSPPFLCVDENLLSDILNTNAIDSVTQRKCKEIAQEFRNYLSPLTCNSTDDTTSIYILQLEELLERAKAGQFVSQSLSLICGTDVTISATHYVTELKRIVQTLQANPKANVVLISQKDNLYLPNINCWCKQNIWMIQMTKDGLRISNEYSLVNAASNMWEQYYRLVPSERKNKESVCQFLNELIDAIPC